MSKLFGLERFIGANEKVIDELYQPLLYKALQTSCSENSNELIGKLESGLFRRRQFVLPVGVEPESFHLTKNTWEFIVFCSGLILFGQQTLNSLLDTLSKTNAQWLSSLHDAMQCLRAIEENKKDNNACRVRVIFELTADELIQVKKEDEPMKTDIKDEATLLNAPALVKSQSLKSLGEDILTWAVRMAETNSPIGYRDGDNLYLLSPLAFIQYSKHQAEADWKKCQKAILKLKKHTMKGSSNFISIGKSSYLLMKNVYSDVKQS